MYGCYESCEEVCRFEGSHLKHYDIKFIPSAGQVDMTEDNYNYPYYGRWIPFLEACFKPSGQVLAGEPNTEIILLIWSI